MRVTVSFFDEIVKKAGAFRRKDAARRWLTNLMRLCVARFYETESDRSKPAETRKQENVLTT